VWIVTAWQRISPEVSVKGFKKCCMSSGMDGSDGMLWNSSEKDGNVRSEHEEDESTDRDDGESDNEW